MKQLYTALAALLSFSAAAQTEQIIGTTTVYVDTVVSNLSTPWEIQLENDDFLWVTERNGIVSRIDMITGEKDTVLDLTGTVLAQSESGLLGLALHPAFATTPEVFLVYTYGPVDGDGYYHERLVKYEWNDTTLINPEILIDDIPTWQNHAGSRLMVLPDQSLLMSTGERYQEELAQDPESLAGKFLRIELDGTIPNDNPDSTSYIYTMGHRNAQGIVVMPDSTVIISEHGPTTDDELSVLVGGNNYGWPLVHGYCDQSFEDAPCATDLYTEPIYAWTPTIAVSDLVYYDNPYFPEWHDRLLMTTLNGQRLVALSLNESYTAVTDEDQYLQGQFGRLRDIAVTSDKRILLATNSGSPGEQAIVRIRPPFFADLGENDELPFTVSPNPAIDYITIDHPVLDATIRVLELNGREVKRWEHIQTGNQLHIVDLTSGAYFLEVTSQGRKPERIRIVKL